MHCQQVPHSLLNVWACNWVEPQDVRSGTPLASPRPWDSRRGGKELSDAEIDVEFGRQPAVGPGGATVRVMLLFGAVFCTRASSHQC